MGEERPRREQQEPDECRSIPWVYGARQHISSSRRDPQQNERATHSQRQSRFGSIGELPRQIRNCSAWILFEKEWHVAASLACQLGVLLN
jgi:hypothetical protein